MIDPESPIMGFTSKELEFLSNHYILEKPLTEDYEGVKIAYPSVTHAYHASKHDDVDIRKRIASISDPQEACVYAWSLPVKKDWSEHRMSVMRHWLKLKFRDKKLKEKLMATYPRTICKYNTTGDTFWGIDQYTIGKNYLGKLLMEIRDKLCEGP